MPKQIGRHAFSGPKPSLERIPKEPGIFVVQQREGTYEKLVKTEAAANLHAALAKYASRSKLKGSDFFSQQQIYTLPLFSLKAGSSLTDEVEQFYQEQDEA